MSPVTGPDPAGISLILRLSKDPSRHSEGHRPTLCQSVVPLCSVLHRPDLQHAFAHKGTLPMGRVLACVGP